MTAGFLPPREFGVNFRGSVRQTLWIDPESHAQVIVTEVFDDKGQRATQHHLFDAENCPHSVEAWRVDHAVKVLTSMTEGMIAFGRAGGVRRFNNRFVAVTPIRRHAVVFLDDPRNGRTFCYRPGYAAPFAAPRALEPCAAGDAAVRLGEDAAATVLARACGSVPDERRAE